MVNVAISGWLQETIKYNAVCRLVKPGSQLGSLFPCQVYFTAMLSVRVANELKRELSLSVDREIFWTDSQVALGYIKNETKKLKFFVANRVQFIQDNTKKSHRCEEGGAHFLAFIDELEKEIII